MQLSNIAGLERWRAWGLAGILGALMALGQAPFHFPWFLLLSAPLLFLMVCTRGMRGAFGVGWWAGLGYFAVALHWIVEPFLVDLAATGWMAPFALLFLSAGLALFWAVPFALFRAFGLGGPWAILAFAGLWTFGEFARSTVLTGFPWALLAYGWTATPIIQATAFIGSHGVGFLVLVLALLPVIWHRVGVAVTLAVLVASWVGLGLRVPDEIAMTDTRLRLVQPNAPQHLKWHPDHIRTFWERQLAATAVPGDIDLIVWPEAAVPYLMGTRPDLNTVISQAAGDRKVALGATRADGEVLYNSAVILGAGGNVEHLYDKHHLVPFGEFLPFPAIFERFGLQGLARNAGRFSAGSGPRLIQSGDIPAFQLLICYEAIFAAEILRGPDRPGWLLHLTNDAWFGDFSGPYQHLAQARVRAVEFGLPMARAANTGVSAMIDPYGRLRGQLALNTGGHVDVELPEPLPPTVYARFGDLPILTLILAITVGSVAFGRRNGANSPVRS